MLHRRAASRISIRSFQNLKPTQRNCPQFCRRTFEYIHIISDGIHKASPFPVDSQHIILQILRNTMPSG